MAGGIVLLGSGTSNNQVLGNLIGLDATGNGELGNEAAGLILDNGAGSNTIGISNTIAYNGAAGIVISGTQTFHNTITRNAIYQNAGAPIDFVDRSDPVQTPQACYVAAIHKLLGRSCPSCVIEVFENDNNDLASKAFIADGTADSGGAFLLTLPELSHNPPFLAVTATDVAGTTSEVYPVPACSSHSIYLPLITR
jgi:hypothetical protein